MGKWRINGEIIELDGVPQDAPESIVLPALFQSRPDLEIEFTKHRQKEGLKENLNPKYLQQEEPFNMPTNDQLANIQHAQPRSEQEVNQYRQQAYGENPQALQQSLANNFPGRPQGPRDPNYAKNLGLTNYGHYGTPEERKQMARDALSIGGGYASLVAPGLFNGIKGAGWGIKTLGEMGTQGIIGAISNPEHALEQGGTQAGFTGGMNALSKALTLNNPVARFVKDRIAPSASAYAAFEAARAAGADVPTASAAALAAYQGGKRFINPKLNKNYNARKYAEKAGPVTEQAKENFNKAKEYGIHLTPGQAGGVRAKAAEKNIGTSAKGAELKEVHNEAQREAKKNAVEKLNKRIYNEEKHDPLKKALYEFADKAKVPKYAINDVYQKIQKTFRPGKVIEVKPPHPENTYGKARAKVYPDVVTEHKSENIIDSLTEAARKKGIPMTKDKNVQDAINSVLKNSSYQEKLKGIPDSELYKHPKFMRFVRQEMGDMYEHYIAKPGGGTKAHAIKESIDKITPVMDKAIPGFQKARELHERSKVVETIRNLTKKGQPHGETLAKYLNNSENKNKLIHNMRNVKGAEKHVNELHEIFKRTENVTDKELAGAISDSFSHSKGESKISLAKDFMNMLKSGDFDEAAVKLTLADNWPSQFERLKRISSTSKRLSEFMKLLSKPSGVAASKGVAHLREQSEKD